MANPDTLTLVTADNGSVKGCLKLAEGFCRKEEGGALFYYYGVPDTSGQPLEGLDVDALVGFGAGRALLPSHLMNNYDKRLSITKKLLAIDAKHDLVDPASQSPTSKTCLR